MPTVIKVPVRIGHAIVVPEDVVLADPAGVIFIPPHLVEKIVERADNVGLKDEFTNMKTLEGPYHSGEFIL